MKNFDQLFWAVLGATAIWAAVTPGKQLAWLRPYRYQFPIPSIGYVLIVLVLVGLWFKTK